MVQKAHVLGDTAAGLLETQQASNYFQGMDMESSTPEEAQKLQNRPRVKIIIKAD